MKKWIALLLSCVMLLAMVAGCGGTPAESPSQSGGAGETAPQSAAPDGETKTYKVGFSNVWVGNTWGVQCVNELEGGRYNLPPQFPRRRPLLPLPPRIRQRSAGESTYPRPWRSDPRCRKSACLRRYRHCRYSTRRSAHCCADRLSDATDKYNVSVVARDYDFGYVGAKWLCEELGGEGNIVCLDGMAGLSSAVLRMQGAQDAFAEYPGINVIASEYADWDYATAKPVMENLLAAYDDIDGIWSSGGDMTRAAIEVWADSGRDWIPMMGEDCNGFLKLWSEYKDDGLSCIATSLPTWLFAYGAELGLEILNGTYEGEKDIIVEIPTITNDQVDDYVRWDLSDSFWCGTKMTEEDIVALYGNGNDGSQGLTGEGVATDH